MIFISCFCVLLDELHFLTSVAVRRGNQLGADGWKAVADALEGVTSLTSLNGCRSQVAAIRKGGLRELTLTKEWELGVWAARFLDRSASNLTRFDIRCVRISTSLPPISPLLSPFIVLAISLFCPHFSACTSCQPPPLSQGLAFRVLGRLCCILAGGVEKVLLHAWRARLALVRGVLDALRANCRHHGSSSTSYTAHNPFASDADPTTSVRTALPPSLQRWPS
jgi:hypothetical protein